MLDGGVADDRNQVEITRLPRPGSPLKQAHHTNVEAFMPQLTIVYWRDIPRQVIVRDGRRAAKRALPDRFEQAIDRCAMKVGARDSDAYLAEWRKSDPVSMEGEAEAVADREAARLDAEFDIAALKALIANQGWRAPDAA